MPELALADEWFERDGQPQFSLLNMMLEESKASPSGFVRLSRHGLSSSTSLGNGPIAGMFGKAGVFSHDLFTLSGGTLYRASDALGAVGGSGPASFAAGAALSYAEVAVTRGAAAYSYDGTDFDAISTPGGWSVRALAYLNGLFFFIRLGTHRVYWSATQDARTIDALDFVSAETEPDEILDIRVVNDGLWLLGAGSVEFWQYTGDAEAPISRVEGALYKKGLKASGCAAELDNTLFWWAVDDEGGEFICRGAGGVPQVVSTPSVDAALRGSAEQGVFAFTHQGHPLLAVRTDAGTLVFDVRVGKWYRWGSYGRTNWRPQCSAFYSGGLVLGDDTEGTVWQFDPDNFDDGSYLEREITAAFPVLGGSVPVHKLGIVANPGETRTLGVDPVIEAFASRDGGKTWSAGRQASLGEQGQYRRKVETRVWGRFEQPGGMFRFRVTDAVPLRVTQAYANEPGGGRSR